MTEENGNSWWGDHFYKNCHFFVHPVQGEHASVSFKAAETTFIGMNVQADPEVSWSQSQQIYELKTEAGSKWRNR